LLHPQQLVAAAAGPITKDELAEALESALAGARA
jgi:hypothetical protein